MPARAFFVFGHEVAVDAGAALQGSNAREGIFCFWTHTSNLVVVEVIICSNAREGIFCFWTFAWRMEAH